MKFPTKFAVLLFSSCLVITSCNKDDDEDPIVPPNTTSLLTSHEWILTNVTLPFPLNGINAWDSMPACEKDNFYKFNIDYSGYVDNATLKCDPLSPQRENYTWMWKDNETTIEIPADSSGAATIFKNVVITTTTMTAKTEWEEQGIVVTANLTFGVH